MGFSTVLPTDPGYKERVQCTCIYHHSHSKSEAEKRDLYLKKSYSEHLHPAQDKKDQSKNSSGKPANLRRIKE